MRGARDVSGYKLLKSVSVLTCGVSQDFVFCTFTFYIYASIIYLYIVALVSVCLLSRFRLVRGGIFRAFAFAFFACLHLHSSRVCIRVHRVLAFAYIAFVIFPASRSFNLVIEGHSSSD